MSKNIEQRIAEYKVRGQLSCQICEGTGKELVGSRQLTCTCVLKSVAVEYLTPLYTPSTRIDKFNPDPLKDKNLIFTGTSLSKFKSCIKSYLLGTNMLYDHISLSAYEIIQAYVKDEAVTHTMTDIVKTDLLFLYLNYDPKNRGYAEVLPYVLNDRLSKSKPIWVLSALNPTDSRFSDKYGQQTAEIIRENFTGVGGE